MRRWIYALTIAQVMLTLAVIVALVGMEGEVTSLRRQIRTGTSMESLVAPTDLPPWGAMPSLSLPRSAALSGVSVQVIGVTADSGQVSLDVLVTSGSPIDLFSVAPLLSDSTGKAYAASSDSRDKAALAALSLGESGTARLTLNFAVPQGFKAAFLLFNNASTNSVQPQLRVTIK